RGPRAAWVTRLRATGLTVRELARHVRVSHVTIRDRLKKAKRWRGSEGAALPRLLLLSIDSVSAITMPMNDLLNTLASEQTKADLPEVRPGDTVRVSVRVVEGNRERVQNFEGTVLRVRNGGLDKQITVRRISSGVGVERTFLMHSPRVEKIELVR